MEQNGAVSGITIIIILLIFFAPLILAWFSRRKRKKAEMESDLAQQKSDELTKRYSPIIDMELHVKRLLEEANHNVAVGRQKYDELLIQAKNEALAITAESKELNSKANQKLNEAKEKATALAESAHVEAAMIIDNAKKQAQDIAGDAFEAKEKADSYESAIRAMKNTIDGYKDDYIIPNHSVLDNLAEEFSFKDAGEKLKQARSRVKELVKAGHAGDCDYVEAHRKLYAVHFAVDAFNGKVDSALAKVKHDNFGKIKQEIIDAFALVNHNGEPFRNARINQAYLDARLDELKWAVATHELRQNELAEQREIKQQIREEEKAQREMEKAIKEAEKEERILQDALSKARAELATANAEQRSLFEQKLFELENKLAEAEARGQRALSMAQQTRRGHVYVISNIGSFGENVFKIGMTRRLEPLDRIKELGDASVPFSFDVHAMIYSENAPALEREMHLKFDRESVNKINYRKEFFRTSLAEIKQVVIEQNITDVHWTMKAEATEYRESLAIEKTQLQRIVA